MVVPKPVEYELWSHVEPLAPWPVSDEDAWHSTAQGWREAGAAFMTASNSARKVDEGLAAGWADSAGKDYRAKAAGLYGSAADLGQRMWHAQYLANAYADDIAYAKTSISGLIRDREPAFQSMRKFFFWPDTEARAMLARQVAAAVNQFTGLMTDRIAARGRTGPALPRPRFVQGGFSSAESGVPPGSPRGLSPSEEATLDRMKADPRFRDRGLRPSSAERDGEYLDKNGRTYDQMGDPRNSLHWDETKFFRAIDHHLNKSMDYTVIDLTGYTKDQIAAVSRHLDSLPADKLAKIIRIGF